MSLSSDIFVQSFSRSCAPRFGEVFALLGDDVRLVPRPDKHGA